MRVTYRNPHGRTFVSKRVIASYVFDWVIIVAIGLLCYGLNKITPHYHPFSLLDLTISNPMVTELISTQSLVLAAIAGPAILIFIVSVAFIPGPKATKHLPWGTLLRRKLWEWNTGWLGLALSSVTSLLIVTGMKNIFGKPRPDMLARCMPDLTDVAAHAVGGFGQDISARWVLVTQTICQQTDKAILDDGFRSFPSGHSGTSWAGLLYLSLYLCSKFAVVFPYLPSDGLRRQRPSKSKRSRARSNETAARPMLENEEEDSLASTSRRDEAAAPPLYLLILLYVPIGVAIFICATRYFDYRHHGFDILSGALIGAFSAWFSFRLYHLPMTRGSGWSWGPRSPDRSFGVSVGSFGYVDEERQAGEPSDLEMGPLPGNSGYENRWGEGSSFANAQLDGANHIPSQSIDLSQHPKPGTAQ